MEIWQQEFFPFWSLRTVKRIFAELEGLGVIVSCQPAGINRTKHYRVNEGVFEKLTVESLEKSPSCQIGTMDSSNLEHCYRAEETSRRDSMKGCFSKEKTLTATPSIPYPKTEKDMYAVLEQYQVEPDPDHDGNFFNDLSKKKWKLNGESVHNWIDLYQSRLQVTTPRSNEPTHPNTTATRSQSGQAWSNGGRTAAVDGFKLR